MAIDPGIPANSIGRIWSLALSVATLAGASGPASAAATAPQVKAIFTFGRHIANTQPVSSVVEDKNGVIYGTTQGQPYGNHKANFGSVFSLTPPVAGSSVWTFNLLHEFHGPKTLDGANPLAGLAMDSEGNLYGTTLEGGVWGTGTVFELTPPAKAGAPWNEAILYSFTYSTGNAPVAPVILGPKGVLFGTATYGGSGSPCKCGVVFELIPPAGGQTTWTYSDIYNFNGGLDGGFPVAAVSFDAATRRLYGTTAYGGDTSDYCSGGDGVPGCGTVFQLTAPTAEHATWSESIIYAFPPSTQGSVAVSGIYPLGNVVLDSTGNLYGTTSLGGTNNFGVVFMLSPPGTGGSTWAETVLHSFTNTPDGNQPHAGLIQTANGHLYGTTQGGGKDGGENGIVFEMIPPGIGQTGWSEKVLASFNGRNGRFPMANVTHDAAGNIFGTTQVGGPGAQGTVFELPAPGN